VISYRSRSVIMTLVSPGYIVVSRRQTIISVCLVARSSGSIKSTGDARKFVMVKIDWARARGKVRWRSCRKRGRQWNPDNLYPWNLARDRPFPSRARFAAVGDGKC